jgi:protein-S-isoprenylcysteine O-methyltransferase Ste14
LNPRIQIPDDRTPSKRQITHSTLVSEMAETKVGKAVAIGAPLIMVMVLALFAVSFLLATLFGLPFSLSLPIAARFVGGAIILAGLAVMAWLFKHRSPSNVILSTYITLTKMYRRTPVAEKAGRTEPLIVDGPQKYMRSPLYFGVVVMVLGWAVLTTYAFVFVATIVILLWFSFVIIPFEERELSALFGDEWKRYSEETPMLFPFTKRKRHADALQSSV